MKKNTFKKLNFQRGFSTLEIMIAMVILILAIGASLLVSSGNQSILIDSQINAEALTITQKTLENEQALARKDFKLVNSNTTTETIGAITYTKEVTVTTDPSNINDFFTKQIVAKISWPGTFGRNPSVSLTSLVTNFENAIGGDTCDSNLSLDWQNNASVKFTKVVSDPITSIDAYKNYLYVTTNNSSASNPTFFIYSIDKSNPSNPKLIAKSSLDNDVNNTGINGVTVAEYTEPNSTKHMEAYVASASSFSRGQMQVIDVTNPLAPATPINFKISNSVVSGSSTQGIGNSIFYKNGYIYLGLTKTVSGPEFNIIDVHNPASPVWVGGYNIGNAVNAIYVRGNYAYIATPNSQELAIVDVSDPSNPFSAGSYDATGGTGNGKSIDVVGDNIYLGRTLGGKELYVLDSPTASPTYSGDFDINASVNGLLVRDYLTFLLANSQLEILNTGSPGSISVYASPITLSSGSGTAIDCEGNYIFTGTDTGHIDIITP